MLDLVCGRVNVFRRSIKVAIHSELSSITSNMLFRSLDGEIVEVCRRDYSTENDYIAALQHVYGVNRQIHSSYVDDRDQTEHIFNLMMGFAPSRL